MAEFLSINIDIFFVQSIVLKIFSKQAVNYFGDMVFPCRTTFFIFSLLISLSKQTVVELSV